MKLSILTTISDPVSRQDQFLEALQCYRTLADEVIVVNGGKPVLFSPAYPNLKVVDMEWPKDWNWVELPKHLNFGKSHCTGDWIIKFDIDQIVHEKDFEKLITEIKRLPPECLVASMQKMSLVCGGKYYQKGGTPIIFRNTDSLMFGKNRSKKTDMCDVVFVGDDIKAFEVNTLTNGESYDLPTGYGTYIYKTGVEFWNYDYFFKTEEFTRKEFWRFSQAYHRYFKEWSFGSSPEEAFKVFLGMMKGRYNKAPYTYKLEDHPEFIREAVKNLKPEQFGYNGWGKVYANN